MQIKARYPQLALIALSAALAMPLAMAQSSSPPTSDPQSQPPASGSMGAEKKSFAEVDANADGKISKEEAAADAKLIETFAKHDKNGDGSLSEDEYGKDKSTDKKY